jgi:hypothetical protein
MVDRQADALAKFELAARLDPYFAAPHFQLFNAYRQAGEAEEAKREFARFQDLRKRQEAAGAGNEDVEWSMYSELVEEIPIRGRSMKCQARPALRLAAAEPAAVETDPATAQLVVMDVDGDGAGGSGGVSSRGVAVYLKGMTLSPAAGPGRPGGRGQRGRGGFRQRWLDGSVRGDAQRAAVVPERARHVQAACGANCPRRVQLRGLGGF